VPTLADIRYEFTVVAARDSVAGIVLGFAASANGVPLPGVQQFRLWRGAAPEGDFAIDGGLVVVLRHSFRQIPVEAERIIRAAAPALAKLHAEACAYGPDVDELRRTVVHVRLPGRSLRLARAS
jgi:hypothetical protein